MDYPIPIEEPVRRVWMKISRYGEIVTLKISDGQQGIEYGSKYVCLSKDDVLELKDLDDTLQKRLAKEKKIVQSRLLRIAVKVWAFILKRR